MIYNMCMYPESQWTHWLDLLLRYQSYDLCESLLSSTLLKHMPVALAFVDVRTLVTHHFPH